MRVRSLMCAVLAWVLAASALGTESVYISDELWVKLRATPTEDARIVHAGLRSGTELEVLGHDLESGYSHVRMSDGREGWIATQYLLTRPIARDRLAQAERKLVELERDNEGLASEVDALNRENVELRQRTEALAEQAHVAEPLLDQTGASASGAAIPDVQSKAVAEMNARLRREVDELVQENQTLASATEQRWMLTGVGLLALGIVLGAFVARRRRGW